MTTRDWGRHTQQPWLVLSLVPRTSSSSSDALILQVRSTVFNSTCTHGCPFACTGLIKYPVNGTDKRQLTWHHYKGPLGLHGNQAGTEDRRRVCSRDPTHAAHILELFADCLQ